MLKGILHVCYIFGCSVWKHINSGFVKVGGVWKSIFSSDILFNGNSALFGNAIGGATSGTEGAGGIPTIANIPPQSGGGDGDGDGGGGVTGFQGEPPPRGFVRPKPKPAVRHNPHTVSGYSLATVSTSKYGNPIGGGTSCFVAGTKISMADGTLKNIEDVVVGEEVRGHNGNNTVIKLDWVLLGDRKLYTFNDSEHYFFTSEHPFMTEEGWKSIKPEKTKERDGVELYDQLKGELKVGDKLVTDNGSIEITDIKSKEMNSPKMPLYNFNVSNDNCTYTLTKSEFYNIFSNVVNSDSYRRMYCSTILQSQNTNGPFLPRCLFQPHILPGSP